MPEITITFPDNSKKKYQKGITGLEIAKSIGERLARDAIAAKLDDELVDLSKKIEGDAKLKIITFKDKEGVDVFRHSTAHILANAVVDIFPDALPTIGPVVEEGFYYDFDKEEPFKPEDLAKIEEKMHAIAKQDLAFERIELTKKQAKEMFKKNKYKLELIDEFGDNLSAYKQGKFVDLCRGPHLSSTGKIGAIKLTKIAGAYWRGDAKNKQLQRVYGISFPDKKELDGYLTLIEEAEKRDHRKIGKEMDLFSFHEEGPGFPFFHPKGTFVYNKLVEFMRQEMLKRGYQENRTPLILNKSLWLQSGHWDHYKENMYFTKIDEREFAVKPMNCPGNLLVYKSKVHSYRELPIRAGEFGLVHRHELSGVLSGLFRVRCFTQDDAHVFCTEEQLEEEIMNLIEFIDFIYKTFGFEYSVELSTMPEKAMGSKEIWNKAENALKNTLDKKGMKYKLNPGEGAFYGPKIDYHLKDAIGRTWQCGTIQVDFSMPEKFELTYEGKDGKQHRPVMLHRAIYGSIERFFGILIEHYKGRFPLWLAPVQARILTVADRFDDYAKEVKEELEKNGLRIEFDSRAESVSYKVRDAQMQKIPLIITIGEKESKDKSLAIRTLDNKVHMGYKTDDLIRNVLKNIEEKKQTIEL